MICVHCGADVNPMSYTVYRFVERDEDPRSTVQWNPVCNVCLPVQMHMHELRRLVEPTH